MSRFVDRSKLFDPPPTVLDLGYDGELARFGEVAQTTTRRENKRTENFCWACVIFWLGCLLLLTIGPM